MIIKIIFAIIIGYFILKWLGYNVPKLPTFNLPSFGSGINKESLTDDDKFRINKKNKQKELDRILDKISKSGIKSLTKTESDFLERWQD